jgi:CcmD family protein
MRVLRLFICVSALWLFVPAAADAQPPQAPGQEEFVPLSEIPPEEQIPAFTLVAVAYAAVWIILLAYVWSVSRRLQSVENELTTLTRKRS